MFWWEPFRSGELLLPEVPSEAETVVRDIPVAGPVLVMAFVLLAMIFLRSFLNVLPYLGDSIFRERGSAALENSVRVSRDRNSIALILLIPAVLLVYRYRIYDPLFVQGLGEDLRLAAVAGVFAVYLLLFLGSEVAEGIILQVEHIIVFVHQTENLLGGQQLDVADAVGSHVTPVANLRLKGMKLVTVVAAQSVPGSKPHKTLLVLQQLGDMSRGYAILFVVLHHMA
jgi:hypothetical protein